MGDFISSVSILLNWSMSLLLCHVESYKSFHLHMYMCHRPFVNFLQKIEKNTGFLVGLFLMLGMYMYVYGAQYMFSIYYESCISSRFIFFSLM